MAEVLRKGHEGFMQKLSRRDFLKLGSALSGTLAVSGLVRNFGLTSARPNILVFVFDAMSAENLSLYGYHRKTTTNLERFAAQEHVLFSEPADLFRNPKILSLIQREIDQLNS